MRRTRVRVKQTQIIVDLRNRGDGGTGIAARAALFDGNRRGKTFNMLDFRLAHTVEELPRVSGKTFHIAALPFRIKGIKGEGGFPRSGKTGDHRQ